MFSLTIEMNRKIFLWKGLLVRSDKYSRRRGSQESPKNSHTKISKFKVFHFSMHLCLFNHHSDFRYVVDICYGRYPWFVPIFWGPGTVKEGVMTGIVPPSTIIWSGAVTTPPIVVSINGTERRTVQIGAGAASVDHSISWNETCTRTVIQPLW